MLSITTIFILIFIVSSYFLPCIVAYMMKNRNLLSIFLLNLFLGWTLVGWVVAIVWAAKKD